MTPDTTAAEDRPRETSTSRVRAMRERQAREGLAEVRGIVAPLADHAAIKAFARYLAAERAKLASTSDQDPTPGA